MKRTFAPRKSYIFVLFLLAGICMGTRVFAAAPPRSLGFQGQLLDGSTPLTSSVNATFTFYDAASGGSVSGSQISKTLTVNHGYFGTQFTESDMAGVNLDQALYIQVNINGTDLSPRTTLNAAPSALKTFGAFSYASAPTVGQAGSLYFNTASSTLFVSDGASWSAVGSSATSTWATNGTTTYYTAGNVGIGTTTPETLLHVGSGVLTPIPAFPGTVARFVNSSQTPGGIEVYATKDNISVDARIIFAANDGSYVTMGQPSSANTGTLFGLPRSTLSFIFNSAGTAGGATRNIAIGTLEAKDVVFGTTNAERMRILANGNVGIGTTSPAAKLDVWGNFQVGTSSVPLIYADTAAGSGGRVGFGTTTPGRTVTIAGVGLQIYRAGGAVPHIEMIQGGAGTDLKNWRLNGELDGSFTIYPMTDANGNLRPLRYTHDGRLQITNSAMPSVDARLYVDSGSAASTSAVFLNGFVGVGTNTPTANLHASGTVRFSSFGAGTLSTDSNGNVTVSSDERLKNIQGMFVTGLEKIKSLSPILYTWKPETGYDTVNTYAGFSAQNVRASIPEAVSTDGRGYLTLSDRPILAALVNAVKELAGRVEGMADHITSRFVEADKIKTNQICVGNTCVTEEQLQVLLLNSGQSVGGATAPSGSGSSSSTEIATSGSATTSESIVESTTSEPTTPAPVPEEGETQGE
jgi:hypothetical protein